MGALRGLSLRMLAVAGVLVVAGDLVDGAYFSLARAARGWLLATVR